MMYDIIDLKIDSRAAKRCIPTEILEYLKIQKYEFFRILVQRFSQGRYHVNKRTLYKRLLEKFPGFAQSVHEKFRTSKEKSCVTVLLAECDDVLEFA